MSERFSPEQPSPPEEKDPFEEANERIREIYHQAEEDYDINKEERERIEKILNEFLELMEEIKKIVIARNHKPFNPTSQQHKQFLQAHFEKSKALQEKYPLLDFSKELEYFSLVL